MESKSGDIEKWEAAEVVRSAEEAKHTDVADLRVKPDVIARYASPPSDTYYPLEYAYHLLGDVDGKTVLDYGCGLGDNSVLLAVRGARVVGVDISAELLELARKRLEQHNLTQQVELKAGSAHDLPIEDESIDVVFGMAILHHLDLGMASAEVFRVLKPGGRAIFLEPVRNSKFVAFIRKMIPYKNPDVSPYERPLTDAELSDFSRRFSRYRSRAFLLPFVNLAGVLKLPDRVVRALVAIDGRMLRSARFLGFYASTRVIEITK
jgi:SAM-dependent methyltransferase